MPCLRRIATGIALACGAPLALASTAFGDLNNFDVFNDTGQETHGFEIEIDGIHATDITYTFDWNHYAYPDRAVSLAVTPKITEDNSDPANPKVFIRYESGKDASGNWHSTTQVAQSPITATDGHTCTNPTAPGACEHFGVGYIGVATSISYHWLVDDGAGQLTRGAVVSVATPSWTPYVQAPVLADPGVVAAPGDPVQQVIAAIPAPVEDVPPAAGQWAEPVWVKVIKTTTHAVNDISLDALSSNDGDGDGRADWTNGEPDQVETEWTLLQKKGDGGPRDEVQGLGDDLGGNDENVTRRYEFYKYAADDSSLNPPPTDGSSRDGETGEAMCSEVDADGVHGLVDSVSVTDPNGDSYTIDCTARIVVGDYIGAQMAAFDPVAGLGLIQNLQNAEPGQPYARHVVVGGDTPYVITVTAGALPTGMSFDVDSGVLSGTPGEAGVYAFRLSVQDSQGGAATADYTLQVGDVVAPQNRAPVANAQSLTLAEDGSLSINLSGSDPDGDTLSFNVTSGPSHGSFLGGVYTPSANYNGSDSLVFVANDGQADSNPATVDITVTPVNDPPVAAADTARTFVATKVTIPVLANDSDVDGDALSGLVISKAALNGTATVSGTSVLYTPKSTFKGTDSFQYRVSDGHGGSATGSVTVTVVANQLPIAVADSVTTPKNTKVTIDVLANDSDPEGGALTVSAIGKPSVGTAAISGNKVVYTPKTSYVGKLSFSYTVADPQGGKASATITVTVGP